MKHNNFIHLFLFLLISICIPVMVGFIGKSDPFHFLPVAAAQPDESSAGQPEEREHHEEHSDEEHHDEEAIQYTPELMEEFGIKLAVADSGTLYQTLEVQGEIVINPETLYHLVPRVSGIVKEVHRFLGDHVTKDDALAVLESRELALLKSTYLAAQKRFELADVTLKREEELWKKKISAEQDFLTAKQAQAEAWIELQSAEQQLHAVGFSQQAVDELMDQPDTTLTRYEFRSFVDGQIIEKHFTQGEWIEPGESVVTVADLSKVWVYLTIYQQDLALIRTGQSVSLSFRSGEATHEGVISFINPLVDEHTRTTQALVVIENSDRKWKPGLFINGTVRLNEWTVPLYVPKTAIQQIGNHPSVFVQTPHGFEPQRIGIGKSDRRSVEVLSGLQKGQTYVSEGGFALKAELDKEAFAHSGHAH